MFIMNLIFLVILSSMSVVFSSKVPVLMWSQSRPMNDIPQVHSGKTVQTAEFSQNYLEPLISGKEGNLVVFVQEKLSLQDLSKYGDVYNPYSDGGSFSNVRKLMDENFSVDLPSVAMPMHGLDEIRKSFEGIVHDVADTQQINNLNLNEGKSHLILITLNPKSDVKNEEEMFKGNDAQVGEAVKTLNKRGLKYSAVFTAKSAVDSKLGASAVHRRLLEDTADAASNYTFVNVSGCLFLYYRSMNLTVLKKNGDNVDRMVTTINDTNIKSDGSCGNSSSMVTLEIDVDTTLKVTISIEANGNSSDWKVEKAEVDLTGNYNGSDFTGNAVLDMSAMWAPKAFSYHCSTYGPITNMKSINSTVNVTLTVDGFQPFDVLQDQFSDGWDCIGFFTEGIWMGIVSMVILITILIYGFLMLADIKTMDRFDDAKGKTITVNVNE